jgi:hypothetical protein
MLGLIAPYGHLHWNTGISTPYYLFVDIKRSTDAGYLSCKIHEIGHLDLGSWRHLLDAISLYSDAFLLVGPAGDM